MAIGVVGGSLLAHFFAGVPNGNHAASTGDARHFLQRFGGFIQKKEQVGGKNSIKGLAWQRQLVGVGNDVGLVGVARTRLLSHAQVGVSRNERYPPHVPHHLHQSPAKSASPSCMACQNGIACTLAK